MKRLISLMCLAMVSIVSANGLHIAYEQLGAHPLEQDLLHYSNEARAAHALPLLSPDINLAIAARNHARDMAQRQYLSHESPDARSRTLAQRVALAGSPYNGLAENLAQFSRDIDVAEKAVAGWLDSRGHRENLLNPDYSHVGFGVALDSRDRVYVVQVFAVQEVVLRSSSITSTSVNAFDVDVQVRTTSATDVLLSYGDSQLPPQRLRRGEHGLRLQLTDASPLHLRLGTASPNVANSFIIQDEGWLYPEAGRFDGSGQAARDGAAIEGVSVRSYRSSVYTVALDFAEPLLGDIAFWVDDEPLRDVELEGSRVRLHFPDSGGVVPISLGVGVGGNRYNIVLSLEVQRLAARAVLSPRTPD